MLRMDTFSLAFPAEVIVETLEAFVTESGDFSLASVTGNSEMSHLSTVKFRFGNWRRRFGFTRQVNEQMKRLIVFALGKHQSRDELVITRKGDFVILFI